MNISEKNFNRLFNGFLFLIAVTLIFRKPCTLLILLFAVFGVCFIKKLQYSRTALVLTVLIASPFLLEILFFWNNDSYLKGFKSMEKSISLVLFPLLILGNFQRISFFKLIRFYGIATTVIILFFFVRFNVVYPDLMDKYLKGIDLWEMGYVFSKSLGIHAPMLNMHLALVTICCLQSVLSDFREKKGIIIKLFGLTIFALSFFFVLFVNTRMALFNALAGIILVLFFEVIQKYNFKKVLVTLGITAFLVGGMLYLFVEKNPYMKEKYSSVTFGYMDKVGKLDEIDHPEVKVFNSLVTRVSIWKSAWELSVQQLPFGVGASDAKTELNRYYKQTNQRFLAQYEFPTHNQFLDFLLKFGILGPIVVFVYIFTMGKLGFSLRNAIILSFCILFFTSNLTSNFLSRFYGIVFSGFWFSVFAGYWLQQKTTADKLPPTS